MGFNRGNPENGSHFGGNPKKQHTHGVAQNEGLRVAQVLVFAICQGAESWAPFFLSHNDICSSLVNLEIQNSSKSSKRITRPNKKFKPSKKKKKKKNYLLGEPRNHQKLKEFVPSASDASASLLLTDLQDLSRLLHVLISAFQRSPLQLVLDSHWFGSSVTLKKKGTKSFLGLDRIFSGATKKKLEKELGPLNN